MKESKKELLKLFLGAFPESTHPYDTKRFIRYALQCIREKSYIDIDAMRHSGKLSDDRIHKLELAYDWIRELGIVDNWEAFLRMMIEPNEEECIIKYWEDFMDKLWTDDEQRQALYEDMKELYESEEWYY